MNIKDNFIKGIFNKLKEIFDITNDDEVRKALESINVELEGISFNPFLILSAISIIYKNLKNKNISKENEAKNELVYLAFKSAEDALDLLNIDYKSGGISKRAISDNEVEVIEAFKKYEWNNYILSNKTIIEFKNKFSSLLKEYGYGSKVEEFIILFDRLLLRNISENPTIIELGIIEEVKELYKYLYYSATLIEKENKIDKKRLADYYIEPRLVKVKDDEVIGEWEITELLNADATKWYDIIASDFGTGKSSYSYYIASKLAKDYLDNRNHYIPILIELNRSNPDNNFENVYGQLNLNILLNKVIRNNAYKILLIIDGLDEYGNVKSIKEEIEKYKESYNNLKVLITTRFIPEYIREFKTDYYIRVEPFTKEQVDNFFKKYGVELTYDMLKSLGLREDEITKPLFAWMLALMHKENKENIRKIDVNKLKDLNEETVKRIIRTVLYHNFIHSLIRGKFKEITNVNEWLKYYNDEKLLLRILSAIHNIYNKIEDNKLIEKIKLFNINKDINEEDLEKALKLIMESYIHTAQQGKVKIYNFIHESFQEYLLAEYYYENIKNGNITVLNVGLPSEECIEFLYGLINILNNCDKVKDMLIEGEFIKKDDKNRIVNNARKTLEKDSIIIFNEVPNYAGFIELKLDNYTKSIESLFVDKWIAINILALLNKLKEVEDEEIKKRIVYIIKASYRIPSYLKNLSGVDLSKTDLFGANLSGAKLYRADLFQADLAGVDLFMADLFEANLTKAVLIGTKLYKAFLFKANLSEANLSMTNLYRADLSEANLSRAELYKTIFYGADLSRARLIEIQYGSEKITYVDDSTITKDVLLVREEDKNNKQKIKEALEKLDDNLRNKILEDNPEYKAIWDYFNKK
jgi:hypothetical protein